MLHVSKKVLSLHHQTITNNKNSSYMETTHNTTNNATSVIIVSIANMDKLTIGDIFLFSTDGPKYVFLLNTPDGRFTYMRCDNKRHFSCRRNRKVFVMDVDGQHYIINGQLFVNYKYGQRCAIRL